MPAEGAIFEIFSQTPESNIYFPAEDKPRAREVTFVRRQNLIRINAAGIFPVGLI
jgi:hypothetical protein